MARVIEYSDPKKIKHRRRWTTVIVGGPAQPEYTGMTAAEKDNAKEEYEVKWKAYADQCRRKHLKGNVMLDSCSSEVHWLSASNAKANVGGRRE